MARQRKSAAVGQVDVFGTIHGLDKLVQKPDVIESEGLKVVHFAIAEEERFTPGYVAEALKQARALQPETKSVGKPPWMTAEWQAKKRKKRDGVL